MPKMTEQRATFAAVAFLIDPANNYTWMEARNNAGQRRDFKEALEQDGQSDGDADTRGRGARRLPVKA